MKNALLRSSIVGSITTAAVLAMALPAAADPKVRPQLPPELENKLNTMLGMLAALFTFAAIAGFLIVAIMMAIQFRRDGGDSVGKLGLVAAACVVGGSASSIVLFLM